MTKISLGRLLRTILANKVINLEILFAKSKNQNIQDRYTVNNDNSRYKLRNSRTTNVFKSILQQNTNRFTAMLSRRMDRENNESQDISNHHFTEESKSLRIESEEPNGGIKRNDDDVSLGISVSNLDNHRNTDESMLHPNKIYSFRSNQKSHQS